MARRKSAVTEAQAAYVDAVLTNTPVSATTTNTQQMARSAAVQEEIARAREEITDATTLKRLDVVEGILDGIGVARMMSDGGNVIRGWVEISKILGFAAPETKTINLNINQRRLRTKFEALSDEDLMAIIEGEAKEIPENGSTH
jgi:coproporphyrinogen III oxidase